MIKSLKNIGGGPSKKNTRESSEKKTSSSIQGMAVTTAVSKRKKIINLNNFIEERKKSPEIPEKCIENKGNNIFIKNTTIKFVDLIGHGGSSIIIKGQDQENGKEYTIKGINKGHAPHIKLEVSLMKKASILIDNDINQHFVKYYKDFKCNKVEDDEIGGFNAYIFKEYFYIIIMELYEGDTTKLLYNMIYVFTGTCSVYQL